MAERSPKKILRCAIYTRKSSEEGLEQDFNSLQAQREACEAFIVSQKHEGWKLIPALYDDGGYSGGTMERPGLKKLLADIQSRLVDVVVVYKVDRLTRSLADFAKIVEVFDAQGVSFVSVTQQFNTTSSMGRLTLNVLLSFAQFEREVTGERIRDKIAASKRKGMWMGGWVPLGYDRKDRTLEINKAEAETVRIIFRLYRELGNVRLVQAELERRKLTTKRYLTNTGRQIGGLPFRRGHIYWILSNPLYAGEIGHKGARHAGQHPAIIKRSDWNVVQEELAGKRHKHRIRTETTSMLAGIVFDDRGNRLSPHNTRKHGRLYRYYVDRPSPGRSAGTLKRLRVRIAATEIERFVVSQLIAFLSDQKRLLGCLRPREAKPDQIKTLSAHAQKLVIVLKSGSVDEVRTNVVQLLHRAIISNSEIRLEVKRDALLGQMTDHSDGKMDAAATDVINISSATSCARNGSETRLVLRDVGDAPARPAAPALLKAIARAHVWFEQLTRGHVRSLSDIAKREGVTDRYVGQTLGLALIAPALVGSILDGRQRPEMTVRSLMLDDR